MAITEKTVSLTWCLSLHLGCQFLVHRWLGGVGGLHLTECPVGFDHTGVTHLATHSKLWKILSPNLHPVFQNVEMLSIPKTVIAWHCNGLQAYIILYWMQSLMIKTLAFGDQSNQWVKVLRSAVSINWGKCPKYTKWCIIQLKLSL